MLYDDKLYKSGFKLGGTVRSGEGRECHDDETMMYW
jgi:hypothetical protein